MKKTCVYYSLDRKLPSQELLKKCLKEYCGEEKITEKAITKDIYGKPHSNIGGLYLSVSHTEGIWVCSISGEPIGIDIENINKKISQGMWELLGDKHETKGAFLEKWIKVESCSKICGRGLCIDWVKLIHYINSDKFYFQKVDILDNYICMICVTNSGLKSHACINVELINIT